jgi:hypothetical protein
MGIELGTPEWQFDADPLCHSRYNMNLSQSCHIRRWALGPLKIFPNIQTSLPIRIVAPITHTTQMK